MSDIWMIVIGGGILTYVTRIAGHVLISRLETIPPRLEAALDAVPAAVLTTIVAPVLITGSWPERIAIVIAAVLSLRLPGIATIALATAFVIAARAMGY